MASVLSESSYSLALVSGRSEELRRADFGRALDLDFDQPLKLCKYSPAFILLIHDHRLAFPRLAKTGQHTGRHAQIIPVPECTVVHREVLENDGWRLLGT